MPSRGARPSYCLLRELPLGSQTLAQGRAGLWDDRECATFSRRCPPPWRALLGRPFVYPNEMSATSGNARDLLSPQSFSPTEILAVMSSLHRLRFPS